MKMPHSDLLLRGARLTAQPLPCPAPTLPPPSQGSLDPVHVPGEDEQSEEGSEEDGQQDGKDGNDDHSARGLGPWGSLQHLG